MARPRLLGTTFLMLLLFSGIPLSMAAGWASAPVGTSQGSAAPQGSVESGFDVVTLSYLRTGTFVGAEGGAHFVYVGLLNGTVWKMNPFTGRVTGSVSLPDGNAAAHLVHYNGALYVGTEWLRGAKDRAPFHVYRIDARTMKVTGTISMDSRYANGLLLAFNGWIWAGDGGCSLYKIDPQTMTVAGKYQNVAEDELVYDGTYYWGECRSSVHVFKPTDGGLVNVAYGALSEPNRPRGIFLNGSQVYTSGSLDFALYKMTLHGKSVSFRYSGHFGNQSYPTRDTLSFAGQIFGYQTGPDADVGRMQARIHIYGHDLQLRGVIWLPGPALPADASQHTLFLYGGRLIFVTATSVGFIVPISRSHTSGAGGAPGQSGVQSCSVTYTCIGGIASSSQPTAGRGLIERQRLAPASGG